MAKELGVNRRTALIGGGAAALAAAMTVRGTAAAQKGVQSGGGIAGGGTVLTADGSEANFSVFGSRFSVDGVAEPVFFGSLRWSDASGVTLLSSSITSYGPVGDEATTREMRGTLAMNDEDGYPFAITMVDAGAPGEGVITLAVFPVGSEVAATPVPADAVYAVDGPLESGDIQLLTFEFPE